MTEATVNRAAETTRNPGLDAVRVFATFLIVVYHAAGLDASGVSLKDTLWGRALASLNIGVPIFFVLSGFLVGRPFVSRFLSNSPSVSPLSFYLRRIARIFPGYWLVLAGSVVLGVAVTMDALTWAKVLVLIQTFWAGTVFKGIGPAWTLTVELSFYLVLPIVFAFLSATTRRLDARRRTRVLVAFLLAVIAFAYVFLAIQHLYGGGFLATANLWLPARADALALGVLIAVFIEVGSLDTRLDTLRNRISSLSIPIAMASVVLWFWSSRIGMGVGFSAAPLRIELLGHFLFSLSSFLFVLPFCLSAPHSRVQRISGWTPIGWLASVSYGVYLWHTLFLWGALVDNHLPYSAGDGRFAMRLAIALPMSIAAGALSFYMVERPVMRWASRRSVGRVDAPTRSGKDREEHEGAEDGHVLCPLDDRRLSGSEGQ